MTSLDYRRLGVLVIVAFLLRVAVFWFLPPTEVEDSYTWWILSIETRNNHFIYTDPWAHHDRLFLPMYAVVSSLFMAILNSEGLWVPRGVSIICGVVVVALTYLITREITSTKNIGDHIPGKWSMADASLVAALLLVFNPFHIFYTSSSLSEPLSSAFLFACLYFFLKTEKKNYYHLPAAGFLFLATLTRYEAWVFLPFFAWIAGKQDRFNIKQWATSALIVLSGPLIWMIWQQHFHGSWRNFFEYYLTGGGASTGSAMGEPVLNALFVLMASGGMTFGLSWFALVYGLKKMAGSGHSRSRNTIIIDKKNFELVYTFFAAFIVIMVLSAGLGLFAGWIRYHISYLPAVFIIFGIGFVDKILPVIENFKLYKSPAIRKAVCAAILMIPLLLTPVFAQKASQRKALTEAAETLARNYQGGRIINDVPSIIYHSGLPVDIFLNSEGIPDAMSLWGGYLKSNDIRYLVWADSGYARISYFVNNEKLIRDGKTPLKLSLLYRTDNSGRNEGTFRVYKIVDYGLDDS